MSGGTISGNETTNANTSGQGNQCWGKEAVHGASGGGVSVYGGTFTMSGTASISANTTAYPLGEGVYVRGNGTRFVMNGGEISGHNRTGVGIDHEGAFTMNGGKIHHNTNPTITENDNANLNHSQTNRSGGGVRVGYYNDDGVPNRATFVMKGGEITENTAPASSEAQGWNIGSPNANYGGGGGVFVSSGEDSPSPPQFTMEGGTISNNHGGGVRTLGYSTFTMKGGTISGNTNGAYGGGVLAFDMFIMTGGTISGNTAPRGGGGFIFENGNHSLDFKKTGGIIYGKDDFVNANVATSGDNSGHALYYQNVYLQGKDKYYDITAGEGVELGMNGLNPSGTWNQ
jgi:hypothetical protein